jgi:hypothetical protein
MLYGLSDISVFGGEERRMMTESNILHPISLSRLSLIFAW